MRPKEQTIRPPKEDDDVVRERKDVIERRASDSVLMLDQIWKVCRLAAKFTGSLFYVLDLPFAFPQESLFSSQ